MEMTRAGGQMPYRRRRETAEKEEGDERRK